MFISLFLDHGLNLSCPSPKQLLGIVFMLWMYTLSDTSFPPYKMAEGGKKEAKKKLPRLGFWEVCVCMCGLDAIVLHSFISFHFQEFMIGGIAAGISKTASAPIERVKLMVQNQDEMIKAGRLATPYKGMTDCFRRVYVEEGFAYVRFVSSVLLLLFSCRLTGTISLLTPFYIFSC